MVNPIMSETLPAVIGMGVTSRAVDTMFDRRGRRKIRGRSRQRKSVGSRVVNAPKSFLYRGHYYKIVYKTAGGGPKALATAKSAKNKVHPDGVVKKTSGGRYAVGIR